MSVSEEKQWVHVQGAFRPFRRHLYWSEDEYRHSQTGQRIVLTSTVEAHRRMPRRARRLSDLLRRKGVSRRWFSYYADEP